jgi:(S)-ureidoglycine aminohydrolase
MKVIFITIILLSSFNCLFAQTDSRNRKPFIASTRYAWKNPDEIQGGYVLSTRLFEGRGKDMEYLSMDGVRLTKSEDRLRFDVPPKEEQLLIVKSGNLEISFADSSWSLGSASIAVLMPGEAYYLQNVSEKPIEFYVMKYRSKSPVNITRGEDAGGSFVRSWNRLVFRPGERGGTRKYFEQATAMCERFEMHVTTLNEGLKSHDPHTHRAEEILLLIDNKTEMQIGDALIMGTSGDVYYLGSNVLHGIRNDGKGTCTYFAFQFE